MKKIFLSFLYICLIVCICGCGKMIKKKELTYETLQEEFGGIIDIDFSSARECMRLIRNKEYTVGGYVIDKKQNNIIDVDLYIITITDDKGYSNERNTIETFVTQDDFTSIDEGDFIYACGKMEYNNYYTENYPRLDCDNKGSITKNDSGNNISVADYVEDVNKIFDDTFFRIEGVIIQDGTDYEGKPAYKLYESEKSYEEDKSCYISIIFSEEQHNLNGKKIKVIGNYDDLSSYGYGLINCSIVDE